MLVRMKNPVRNLTRDQKIGIGIGAGAVLAITTIALVASASDKRAPRKAITVDAGCSSFTIHSVQEIEDGLRDMLRSESKRGPVDPLDLTRRYLSKVSGNCPTYPGPTQLPMVRLFAAVYMTLLGIMKQGGIITAEDYVVWHGMFITWAAGQGVSQEDLG